jgi:hypothetical protein
MNNPGSEDKPRWIMAIIGTTRTASPHLRNHGQSNHEQYSAPISLKSFNSIPFLTATQILHRGEAI